MFQWLFSALERRGRKHIITDREGKNPYLVRYYVAFPDSVARERKDIPFNVFLHQFIQSDDPVWHDHPWNWFISIVVSGGYVEHTPWGDKKRGRFNMRFVNCNKLRHIDDDPTKPMIPANIHWVEIAESGKTWTLFVRGRTNKDWGFFPNMKTGDKIPWREYLEDKVNNNDNTSKGSEKLG